jgi:hypothetical protein
MRMIKLGELKPKGDASKHLVECLSGQELPLAGIAQTPYVPGDEILEGYAERLFDPGVCFLVKTDHALQVLSSISQPAHAEARNLYYENEYLPFQRSSCRLIS